MSPWFQIKISHFNNDKVCKCKYRIGTTGTLDGTQTHKFVLEGLFGKVHKVTTTKDLIEKKHLLHFKINH